MDKVSYVGNADVTAIDYLYQSYLKEPQSVDLGWQKFSEGLILREQTSKIKVKFQKISKKSLKLSI